MKIVTLSIDRDGHSIHEKGKNLVESATEPMMVIMEFHNNNTKKLYSFQCATEGEEALAREYFQFLLDTHDRYYDYSDDHRVWTKGNSEWNHILWIMRELKKRNIPHMDIFDKWNEKYETP